MKTKELIELAMEWSLGEPELCAEMAVALTNLNDEAYAEGFKDGLKSKKP
jgi:hypothetical protein